MKLTIHSVTDEDALVLKRQIGIDNNLVFGIILRCSNGFPQVVVLNPVAEVSNGEVHKRAFENILWLTCPSLREKIDDVEDSGMRERAGELLKNDRGMASLMTDAHAHYYYFRKEIYRRASGKEYSESMIPLFDTGIGGIKDPTEVRCLHMHYAHYRLCPSNVVGRAVEKIIGKESYCGCAECRCKK